MLRRFVVFLLSVSLLVSSIQATDFTLAATPGTVCWGYYWAKAKPALRVHSGDSATIGTLIATSPEALSSHGLPDQEIQPALKAIYEKVTDKGPGGHILTGPIFIEEAEPGDTLEVRIQKITLDVPYAYNAFSPGRGFLPDEFPYARYKIIPLNRETLTANFAPGVVVPLRPFFGSMGVAPPSGRIDSAPPYVHAGNMDNKELVEGTILFLPVHVKGALFEVGDGHAGQGNGEVDITAMETSLTGTFQFIVHKGKQINWPRAETPTHYITMGFNQDLTKATELAVREMIDFLITEKHLSRDDAYMLTSIAVDVDITQLVDGNKGAHAMCPKALFKRN